MIFPGLLACLWACLETPSAPTPTEDARTPATTSGANTPVGSSAQPATGDSNSATPTAPPATGAPSTPASTVTEAPSTPASTPAPNSAPDEPLIDESTKIIDRKTRFSEAAAFDIVGGGSRKGTWAGAVQAGYPWQALRFQYGLHKTLTALAEVESALFRRFRPAVGLGLRWVDRPRVRLTGDVLLGWLIQTGELDRRGPNGELRLRLAFPSGRVAPYLMVATRHTLLFDRTQTVTTSGVDTSWGVRHEWTPWATLGMAIAINHNVGLEFGIDWPWVGAPEGVSIPGIHASVLFGGGR